MTYNIYSLYYKIAAERKKDEPFYRSFITLLETFNLSILILEKLLMCSCYVNCILWQHTRLINRKFLTRNIEKHQVKHDSFFFLFISIYLNNTTIGKMSFHLQAKQSSNTLFGEKLIECKYDEFFREFTVDGCNENGITSGPKCFEWLGFHKLSESIPNTSGKGRKNRKFRWHGFV